MTHTLLLRRIIHVDGDLDQFHAVPRGEHQQLQLRLIAGGQQTETVEPFQRIEPVARLGISERPEGLDEEPEIAESVGKAASSDDGYVTVANMKPGKSSFSVAFWMKTPGVDDDPCIISNKNWNDGRGPGFVVSLRAADTKFNVGNKLERMDYVAQLPFDYTTGWVYVVYVVDRENNLVKYSYDFSPFDDDGIPGSLKSADFSVGDSVNIGQDGTGKYRAPLSATLDEVLIIDGVLTDEDVAKLKKAYQAR